MTILFSVAFFHNGWLQAIELQADRLGFFNRISQLHPGIFIIQVKALIKSILSRQILIS